MENDIRDYLRTLPPHVASRQAARLLTDAADEIDRLQGVVDAQRKAIDFCREKCVSRTAGNINDPFAWLPQRDWDDFVKQAAAAEAAGGEK